MSKNWNRIDWKKKWHDSFAHQRMEILQLVGFEVTPLAVALAQKKFDDLDDSILFRLKGLVITK